MVVQTNPDEVTPIEAGPRDVVGRDEIAPLCLAIHLYTVELMSTAALTRSEAGCVELVVLKGVLCVAERSETAADSIVARSSTVVLRTASRQ